MRSAAFLQRSTSEPKRLLQVQTQVLFIVYDFGDARAPAGTVICAHQTSLHFCPRRRFNTTPSEFLERIIIKGE